MWRGTVRRQQTARMGKTLIGKAPESPRGEMRQARKVEIQSSDAARPDHGAPARRTRRPPPRHLRDPAA
jgi:hypothetical protein